MVRNREQAEDLAQEVFLRVYRARAEYVPSAKFTTWLFRIATNLALNSLRDNRYQKLEDSIDAPARIDSEDGDDRPLDVAEKHPNIEQHLVEVARVADDSSRDRQASGKAAGRRAAAQIRRARLCRDRKDSQLVRKAR